MTANKGLSVRTAQALIDAAKPGLWAHLHGLALSITKAGSASWTFRYTAPGRRRRLMTLEGVNADEPISAAGLRVLEMRAEALRRQVRAGHDPLAVRHAAKPTIDDRAARVSFEEAARAFIAEQQMHWKNEKHKHQWSSTLTKYVYPVIGRRAVHEITTRDVVAILKQPYKDTTLWNGARETASRVRMRIEAIINHEFSLNHDSPSHRDDWLNHHNPARWKSHLENLFKSNAKPMRGHFSAMAWNNVPAFVAELSSKTDYSARALILTILCAARTSETLNATWAEFELDTAIWTISAARMKAGVEHRVPLSSGAIKLLKALPRIEGHPYVFPGAKRNQQLSNMAMLEMLRGMRDGLTVHGFRSAFRDWAAETTLHPDTIAEIALAHTIKDKTIAAYRRGDAFERRRDLMQQWCDYISTDVSAYHSKWTRFIALSPHSNLT